MDAAAAGVYLEGLRHAAVRGAQGRQVHDSGLAAGCISINNRQPTYLARANSDGGVRFQRPPALDVAALAARVVQPAGHEVGDGVLTRPVTLPAFRASANAIAVRLDHIPDRKDFPAEADVQQRPIAIGHAHALHRRVHERPSRITSVKSTMALTMPRAASSIAGVASPLVDPASRTASARLSIGPRRLSRAHAARSKARTMRSTCSAEISMLIMIRHPNQPAAAPAAPIAARPAP